MFLPLSCFIGQFQIEIRFARKFKYFGSNEKLFWNELVNMVKANFSKETVIKSSSYVHGGKIKFEFLVMKIQI